MDHYGNVRRGGAHPFCMLPSGGEVGGGGF